MSYHSEYNDSKQRYLAYLRSNCDMSFGEWLKGGFCHE